MGQHMVDDWSTKAVGGRRWRRDSSIISACKVRQHMKWVYYPGETKDKTDYQGNTNRFCGNQHHARFWDDLEHERDTDHGRLHQWVVGGIHHEKAVIKFCGPRFHRLPCGARHNIDRDWDRARMDMARAMRKHCVVPRWRYHPGADGPFQDIDNEGYLLRISLHHADDGGCDGW